MNTTRLHLTRIFTYLSRINGWQNFRRGEGFELSRFSRSNFSRTIIFSVHFVGRIGMKAARVIHCYTDLQTSNCINTRINSKPEFGFEFQQLLGHVRFYSWHYTRQFSSNSCRWKNIIWPILVTILISFTTLPLHATNDITNRGLSNYSKRLSIASKPVNCRQIQYGYMDKSGRIVIKVAWDEARPFSEGLALVRTSTDWFCINNNGVVVFKFARGLQPDDEFHEGRCRVRKNGDLYGFVDTSGILVIPATYERASRFYGGSTYVLKSAQTSSENQVKQVCIIDKNGLERVATNFDSFGSLGEGLWCIKVNDKWGFADPNGKIRIEPQYLTVEPFSDGVARVILEKKWSKARWLIARGFIDKSGHLVFRDDHYYVDDFYCDRALAFDLVEYRRFSQEKKQSVLVGTSRRCIGYLDKQGHLAISLNDNPKLPTVAADRFSEGLAVLVVKDRCGYINHSGSIAIEPIFNSAHVFRGGLAAVRVNGKWGFVNQAGKLVIEPKFERVGDFNEQLAVVGIFN